MSDPDHDRDDFARMLQEFDLLKYAHALHRGAEYAGEKLEVRGFPVIVRQSPVHGLGAFVRCNLGEGQLVAPAVLNGHRTAYGWYVNHGHRPNVEAHHHGSGRDLDWYAITDLYAGQELLADYRRTVRLALAVAAGIEPHELTHGQIRSSLLRLWVAGRCPL